MKQTATYALIFFACLPTTLAAQSSSPARNSTTQQRPVGFVMYVNQDCAILPSPEERAALGKKFKKRHDDAVCHIEGAKHSLHNEEHINGNQLERSDVYVHEQEYVVQNITSTPIDFVVEHELEKGMIVDSFPAPTEVLPPSSPKENATAIFRIHAEPGQIVHLHVGQRRTVNLRPKSLKQQ